MSGTKWEWYKMRAFGCGCAYNSGCIHEYRCHSQLEANTHTTARCRHTVYKQILEYRDPHSLLQQPTLYVRVF